MDDFSRPALLQGHDVPLEMKLGKLAKTIFPLLVLAFGMGGCSQSSGDGSGSVAGAGTTSGSSAGGGSANAGSAASGATTGNGGTVTTSSTKGGEGGGMAGALAGAGGTSTGTAGRSGAGGTTGPASTTASGGRAGGQTETTGGAGGSETGGKASGGAKVTGGTSGAGGEARTGDSAGGSGPGTTGAGGASATVGTGGVGTANAGKAGAPDTTCSWSANRRVPLRLGFPFRPAGPLPAPVRSGLNTVFRYRYHVVGSTLEIQGCRVASLEDIGAIKLAAICQRSVKRDYVDLHAILTMGGVSVGDLVDTWNRKFPGKDVGFALRALVYFADVERARMPEMLSKTTWEKVKTDLENLVALYSGT
jgi:hypothetical protein